MLMVSVAVPYPVGKGSGKSVDQPHGFDRPFGMIEDVACQKKRIGSSVGHLPQEACKAIQREEHAEMHIAELGDRIPRERAHGDRDIVATLDRRIPLVKVAVERDAERGRWISSRCFEHPAPLSVLRHGEHPAIHETKDNAGNDEEEQEHQGEKEDGCQRNRRTIREKERERIAPHQKRCHRDGKNTDNRSTADEERTSVEDVAQRPERRCGDHRKNGDQQDEKGNQAAPPKSEESWMSSQIL